MRRNGRDAGRTAGARPTLRSLADQLRLSPASVSLVLNHAPAARAIPKATQDRIRAAAARAGYRPNTIAKSLRHRRTRTIGVMVPEISEGYAASVMSGIEDKGGEGPKAALRRRCASSRGTSPERARWNWC